ncbi:hypothetical protein [Williamsia sterculiae]|uniref:Uncharacterized protein n=1 Tax=Williamsia sterculiae TaxID=1344003 RepID=A0A1N7GGC8_9NOCA|nr:hypothetical protein [Williamsia sterculiae]SIS11657.1 hypothetical protein SAMN05445060_2754 [Williamsia sterculiae]
MAASVRGESKGLAQVEFTGKPSGLAKVTIGTDQLTGGGHPLAETVSSDTLGSSVPLKFEVRADDPMTMMFLCDH